MIIILTGPQIQIDGIDVYPLYDNLIEFDETVTLTLTPNPAYSIDPQNSQATVTISDCFLTQSNIFTVVTNFPGEPVGIDYDPVLTNLIVSIQGGDPDFQSDDFVRLGTNGAGALTLTNWSEITGLPEEVKLATVKTNVNSFVQGDTYFGSDPNSTPPDGGQTLQQEQPPMIGIQTYQYDENYSDNRHLTNFYQCTNYPCNTSPESHTNSELIIQDCWVKDWDTENVYWKANQGGYDITMSDDSSGLCGDSPSYENYPEMLSTNAYDGMWGEEDDYNETESYPGDIFYTEDYKEMEKFTLNLSHSLPVGASRQYTVLATMNDGYNGVLLNQWFAIRGQTLTDSTQTNAYGTLWGQTTVTIPSGVTNLDVTPINIGDSLQNLQFPEEAGTNHFQEVYYQFDLEIAKDKLYWQNMVMDEIDDSGVTIENYKASGGFNSVNRMDIKAVYAFYQKLFVNQNNFLWAGLAKLAGAPVYAGLSDAEQVSIQMTNIVFTNTLDLELQTNGVIFVQTFQQTLIGMNIAILDDLAWQFEAYKNGGLAAIQTAYAYGNSDLNTFATNAWGKIDQGILNNNPSLIQQGNEDLLQREQQQILADGYQQLTTMSNLVTWGMSQFAKNPVPGGPDFITLEPSGNIADFDARWDWITHSGNGVWPLWVGTALTTQLQWVEIPLTTFATNYVNIPHVIQ